ncbi:MAG: GrpB family protein [Pseudomonadota bacterium]
MRLTSDLTAYDPAWPRAFDAEAARLAPIFGAGCVAVHHVGSTAVPGLLAKPEIDILVTVLDDAPLGVLGRALEARGYRRGRDLAEGHRFFKRDVDGVRTHKLHVCAPDHPRAARMLAIRDHLRADAGARRAYADLKLRLARDNRAGIAEYLAGKAPFLEALYISVKAAR